MARPKPKGPDSLDRWSGEGHIAHRGLLLWAMQRPAERSFRAVARATGKGDTTVRKWAARYRWEERASAPNHEEEAVMVYRRDYVVKFGKADLHHVASRCSYPVAASTDAPPPSEAKEAILKSRSDQEITTKFARQRAAEAAEAEVKRRRREQETELRKEELIIDIALGFVSQELSKGAKSRIRPTLRDIPVLLEAKRVVQRGKMNLSQPVGEKSKGDGPALVESARVRHAKVTGSSVIQAMLDDTEEMRAVLGALVAKEDYLAEQEGQDPEQEIEDAG